MKTSYIDERQLTGQFNTGEVVQLIALDRDGTLPYYGRITAVHENIGFLDVQTDFGNVRLSPLEVAQIEVKEGDYLEDTGYSSWEKDRAKERVQEVADNAYQRFQRLSIKSSSLKNKGFSEMKTYNTLFKEHSSRYSDHEIKEAVKVAYGMKKESLYWKEKGRNYCPSKQEREEGVFHCPKCKTELQKAIYKKYSKLYVCTECLWMIAPEDLIDPTSKEDCDDTGQEQLEDLEETDEDFLEPNDPRLDKNSSLNRMVKEAARKYFNEDSEDSQLLEELGKARKFD